MITKKWNFLRECFSPFFLGAFLFDFVYLLLFLFFIISLSFSPFRKQQSNHSMLGVHASAWAIIHYGYIARKQSLTGVCLDSLSRYAKTVGTGLHTALSVVSFWKIPMLSKRKLETTNSVSVIQILILCYWKSGPWGDILVLLPTKKVACF